MKHILTAKQFTKKEDLNEILVLARYFKTHLKSPIVASRLKNKVIATIFFEPSTRTRLSFESAALRLGGKVISCENAFGNASAAKGESIEDTTRVVSGYADLMVIRHPEKDSVCKGAQRSSIPVINAGDGVGEHPTQGLLDIFTMYEEFGDLSNKEITFVGDLKNGRTLHSTIQLVALFPNTTINLVSPDLLPLPQDLITLLQTKNCSIHQYNSWESCITSTDVLYMTRVQKERFNSENEYKSVKDNFILTEAIAQTMKKESIIMHPLPRVNEIDSAVDTNERARYFQQAHNGLYVRMALLDLLLNEEDTLPISFALSEHTRLQV
jgi:aspartate carbamoyltransferase